MAVHSARHLVFMASNDQIHCFRAGVLEYSWGSDGSADGQFFLPSGMVIDTARELLFVVEFGNHRVQVFNFEGVFIRKWGSFGVGDLQFNCPFDIALQRDSVFITDTHNHRVVQYTVEGVFERKWSSEIVLTPHAIAVHPSRDLVFVCDFDEKRETSHSVHAFRCDGQHLFAFESTNPSIGPFRSCHHSITVHPTRELVFITESVRRRIQVFSVHGVFHRHWKMDISPRIVKVDVARDAVYVRSVSSNVLDEYTLQEFEAKPKFEKLLQRQLSMRKK